MRLDIRYRCSFEYDDLVRESQNELRVCPISDDRQTLLSYRVHTAPAARVYSFEDYWGTRVDAFGVREPHIFLEVVAEATVETKGQALITSSPNMSAVRDPWFTDLHIEHLERTRHVDWDDALRDDAARQVELAGDDVVSAVLAIHRRAGSRLTYEAGSTYVGVPIEDLLARGTGVCQDYAHLAIAMCRSVGIPARYVSGYLFTANDSTGADVDDGDVVSVQTHAWFEAAIPGFGWFALDPTNRQEVSLRHVTIGRGRDYDDVPPLRGVYTGPPEAALDVAVEMRRLGEVTAQLQAQAHQAHAQAQAQAQQAQ